MISTKSESSLNWSVVDSNRRDRQEALFAVFLGDGEPFQGLWLVVAPLPDADHRCGFLLGGLPAFPLDASRLLAFVLAPPCDGSGARGNRVDQQIP